MRDIKKHNQENIQATIVHPKSKGTNDNGNQHLNPLVEEEQRE